MPLPPGLALNPSTGVISGTPTTAGTYTFTLRVRDSQGLLRDTPAQTIVVNPYTAPSLSGTLPQFANRASAYSGGLTLANGTAPFTWSISAGTLPTGITIDSATGVISGTPTDTSYTDRNITVRVVDNVGSPAQSNQTIRYADVLSLSGALASGVQSTAYSSGFTRSGGHSAFTWAITSGSLPAGLSFNTTTGVISGTPTGTSSTALTIRVTDASGAAVSRSDTLTIASAYTPLSFSGSVTSNSQNVETLSSFSITPSYAGVSVSGGSGSPTYSWARISGSTAISAAAPSSLGTSFVGTVAPSSSVSATFRVTVTDGISSDTLDVTITVTNTYVAMVSSVTLGTGTRTVAYSNSVGRTGGKSPFSFAVISGTLPTGITLNSSTGALSGTPTDTFYADRALTFRVTDALGATADASSTLTYRNFPAFSITPAPAMRTRSYSAVCEQTVGGHTPGTFSLVSGTLPTGLTLSSGGTISGTPTDTSYTDRTITIRLTDAIGNVANVGTTITYRDNLALAGSYTASGTSGVSYSSSGVSASGGYGSNVWSVASGSLPGGLTLNTSTGAITGTPSSGGTFNFTVRVTDAQGFTADSAAQSIAVAAALAVSASPTSLAGVFTNSPASNTPATRTVTTSGSTTATATGGSGGYTYAWTRISGSTAISAGSPSSATTSFSGDVSVGDIITATFRVTATDSSMATATADVTVELTYESGF